MFNVAIDGPGGAGKSSVAKEVAKRLGIIYVDTGALYRTIALHIVNRGIDPKDSVHVEAELAEISIELAFENEKQIILLNGAKVGDEIRTPEISMAASTVSAIPAVREFLLETQRTIAKNNSVIMDGRDIGTVILPDAKVKIFLTASPKARAKRRYKELLAKGQSVTYEDVYADMVERDKNDTTRAVAPCKRADDAVLLDNSKLTAEETTRKVIKIIRKKLKKKMNLYMFLHGALAPTVRFIQRIKPIGLENVPLDGSLMICSNHIAAKDVIMIGAVFPRQIRFVAKKELFKIPLLGWFFNKLGVVKLDRGGADVGAIKTTVELAKSGETVAIFPQGHRYPGVSPSKTPIKNGAGLIAYHSGCDVIPVCIKTTGNKYRFLRKIEVRFGKPIKNSEFSFDKGGSAEYKLASEKIFNEILKLGDYAALPSPTGDETQSET